MKHILEYRESRVISKIWKLQFRKLGQICFDILTLGFNICTVWLLVLGFPAKLYDKNSVQIQVNILIKNIV